MGGPSVDQKMSHQQNWMFQQFQPYFERMMKQRAGYWRVPRAVLPDKKWWKSLSPKVKAGLWAPWEESAEHMKEFMGVKGQVGSMSSNVGHTGSYADAQGRLFAEAGKDVGMQAWRMSSPGLSAEWQAKLQRRMAPMSVLGMMPNMLPTGFISPGKNYGGPIGGLIGSGVGGYFGGPQGALMGGSAGSQAGTGINNLFSK